MKILLYPLLPELVLYKYTLVLIRIFLSIINSTRVLKYFQILSHFAENLSRVGYPHANSKVFYHKHTNFESNSYSLLILSFSI